MAAPPAVRRPAPGASEGAPTDPPPAPPPIALGVSFRRKGGPEQRSVFEQAAFTIGRDSHNDVSLPQSNVSKQHARVDLRDGVLLLTDLGSTNGTYINGRKVERETVVTITDQIYIGDYILRFEVDPLPQPPPPPSPHPASQPEPQLAHYERFAHALHQRAIDLEGGTMAERFEALCQQADQHYDPHTLGPLLLTIHGAAPTSPSAVPPPSAPRDAPAPAERVVAIRSLLQRALELIVGAATDAPPVEHQPAVVRLSAAALRRQLQQRNA